MRLKPEAKHQHTLKPTFILKTGFDKAAKHIATLLIFMSFFAFETPLMAQVGMPGKLDTTFNFGGLSHDFFTNLSNPEPGRGPNSTLRCMLVQPDGKVLISGLFSNYNGLSRSRMARLNPDGSIDPTFNPGSGPGSNSAWAMALQADGKIIIGGDFTSFNGTARNRIARLNADGSVDLTFNSGTGANGTIRSIALQPDGKVVIAGDFTTVSGVSRNRIARLNANGSLDANFDVGTGANGSVRCVQVQADGNILIGGGFTQVNQTVNNHMASLLPDGSVNISFSTGLGLGGIAIPTVNHFAIQPDGKVVIAGEFGSYNGFSRGNIVRVFMDGGIDTSFNAVPGAGNQVQWVVVQPDEKVILAGDFLNYNGTTVNRMVRVEANGNLDTTFIRGFGPNATVTSMLLQPDGHLLVAGNFSQFNFATVSRLTRLDALGEIDLGFNEQTGANNPVRALAYLPDGTLLVGGEFTNFNGRVQGRIARMWPDGGLDSTFMSGTGAAGQVNALVMQPDGKVLIGGVINSYNGIQCGSLARLFPDGRLDTSFSGGNGLSGAVTCIALQADGKILIGGTFNILSGGFRRGIARLLSDGSIDTSFNVGTGINTSISSIAVQADGKILIGGLFTTYNGIAANRLARLHPDGRLDSSFVIGTGVDNGTVQAIIVRPDNKIFVAGSFSSFNSIPRNRLVLLHANGSIDWNYLTAAGASGIINALAYQPDGKLLMAGEFAASHGISRNRIARLNADGSLDVSFDPGTGTGLQSIFALALQPDGKALIGGSFLRYDGVFQQRIARIFTANCATTPTNLTSTASICPGSSKSLNGTPGANWVIASGPGSIQGTTYHATTDTGTVWVYNQLGDCLSPLVSFEVRLPETPEVPSPAPICAGEQATIVPVSGGVTYSFYADSVGGSSLPGGNGVSRFTTPNLGTSTSYFVASVADSGCESLTRKEVRVQVMPLPEVVIRQLGDTLTADSLLGTYQWYRDSMAISGDTTRLLVPNLSGTYTLRFTDSLGCTGTSNSIQVIIASTPFEQAASLQWTTYPVPFNTQLIIEAEQPFSYALLNMQGAVLLSGQSYSPEIALSTAHLASGVYIVRMVVNGQAAFRRVVKQ